MLQEMVESGRVSRFDTPVLNSAGIEETTKVTRVGLFNAVQDGQYLHWLPDVQKLSILGRQPEERFRSTAEDLSESNGEMVKFALDPSPGSILSLLVQTPTLRTTGVRWSYWLYHLELGWLDCVYRSHSTDTIV